jgi:hypothetical protein
MRHVSEAAGTIEGEKGLDTDPVKTTGSILGRADEVSSSSRLGGSDYRGRQIMWAWLYGGGHWR